MLTRIASKKYVHYHKDGSIWAKGKLRAGKPDGYWEWYRKSGTRMRSGYFKNGVQIGEWTTYDQKGAVYKVTVIKPKITKKKTTKAKTSRSRVKPAAKRVTRSKRLAP